MTLRTPIRRISSKRLAQRGGKVFSTIQKRGKPPVKRKTPRAVHSERTAHITGHRRIRLYGKAREQRRAEIFARAEGRCEERIEIGHFEGEDGNPFLPVFKRCPNSPTEWSHKKHGARKCDCMECGIASCTECHKKRHNAGGKPVPRKPKILSMEE